MIEWVEINRDQLECLTSLRVMIQWTDSLVSDS